MQKGRDDEACELYKTALKVDGGQVIALSNYGHILCRKGVTSYPSRVCFTDSVYVHASKVARASMSTWRGFEPYERAGELDKAEEIFKQGLKKNPSEVTLLHNYGCLLWEVI